MVVGGVGVAHADATVEDVLLFFDLDFEEAPACLDVVGFGEAEEEGSFD